MKTVLTNARFKLEKCVGCKTCTHVCPTKAYTHSLNRPLEKMKIAPCAVECPIGNDIEGFVFLAGKQRYLEAYTLLLQTNPFPGTTGRVCHHPCEQGCSRMKFDESVSIRSLERFAADYAMEKGYMPPKPEVLRKSAVAVIGAGPAGLSCAFHLGRLGYRVTLFEAAGQPGGLLRYGIPEYRLPEKVLDWEIGNILSQNVEIRTNQRLGKNLKFGDLKNFDALFLAIGLQNSRRLMIPNEKAPGVYSALDFLKAVNEGQKVDLGNRIAVIGGGNSAVDTARCLRRMGATPVILYRRSVEEMPALAGERHELEREGIEIVSFVTPIRILSKDGRIRKIACIKTCPGEAEADGRRMPVPIEGSEFSMDVDNVLVAAGELPDFSGLVSSLGLKEGRLVLGPDGVTLRNRVFAGGDVATGVGRVSKAIGSGEKGALAIHAFLEGGAAEQTVFKPEVVSFEEMNPDYFYAAPKKAAGHLEPGPAVRSFDEVCLGYPEEQARYEAQRCFGCAAPPIYTSENCRGCTACADRCPASAISIEPLQQPFTVGVDPGRFDPEEIMRICKKAKVHPKQVVCYCTDTRAGEIAAAILKGARTPEDVSRMTGARTGCTVLCVQSIVKLLEASGQPVKPAETHQCYGKTFTAWDMDPGLKKRDEKRGYHLDDDVRLIEKVFENK
jgi:NADPH-dependent glutamate synthase beta subunit-like oxidoreductase/bacterioferritin-associated ferredoxin